MLAQDVRRTRLAAAASTAAKFLTTLPKEYSVAVIGIGTRAYVALPPTTDRVLARDALDSLAPSEGTALGDAVLLSVKLGERRRTSDGAVPPTSVLLISDGARDGGQTAPLTAARAAHAAHIPISTVLVGTANGVVVQKLVGGFEEQIRVPPSPGTLQQIARLSGGRFFPARTTPGLEQGYKSPTMRTRHQTQSPPSSDLFARGAVVRPPPVG